ncbi:MAG: GDSL-type esterase/lipase family protein, partial [Hyphomicrobiales bacterium]
MIGINNLLTGQPLDEVKEDLNSLKDVVCGQQAKIIWMSVLPVNPEIFRREILSRSPNVYLPSSEQIFDLNEHIRGISDTCPNITFFDVSDSFMDVSGNLSSEFTIDGLHLSSAGSKALAMIVGELSHEK